MTIHRLSVETNVYRWEYTNLKLEAVSDLAGDSMMLSGSESPTDNPFRLDAIICMYNKQGGGG
jgi:hypothetical protein